MKTEHFDEQQRNDGASDCSHQVGYIKKTERALRFVLKIATNGKHCQWNGGSHARAPRDHGESQPCSGHQVISAGRNTILTRKLLKQTMAPKHLQRYEKSRSTNQELTQSIEAQRRKVTATFIAADQRAGSPRAQAQPGHEHREHDGNEWSGDAELRHRQAQPDQLVQNAAESRDQEKEEVPDHTHRLRSV